MNIHFTDENLFYKLMKNKLLQIEVGSHMYNLTDEYSDIDSLIIYTPFKNQLNSAFTNHHQLQYKYNGVDYIFVDLITFIRNAVNGDSTINFEVINSNELINTKLELLYNNRIFFYNYNIIKGYLGLAKRDLKQLNKVYDANHRSQNKRLIHAIRGYYTAYQIMSSLEHGEMIYNNIQPNIIHKELLRIKTIQSNEIRERLKHEFTIKIVDLRQKLNSVFDNNNYIPKYMNVIAQQYIDGFKTN